MYIDLSVRNLFSFGEEQTFSFEAYDKVTDYEKDFVVEIGKYKLLKMLMIYGANASGKSNMLKCFSLLNDLITEKRDIKERINVEPFLLDPVLKDKPSMLRANFLIKKADEYVRYKYELNFTSEEILSEKLDYYPTTQPALVFERKKDLNNQRGLVLKIGTTITLSKADQEVILANTLKNNTILSVFNRVNPLFEHAKHVWEWFDSRSTSIINNNTSMLEYTVRIMSKEIELANKFRDYLVKADFNISKIQVEKNEVGLDELPKELVDFLGHKDQHKRKEEATSKPRTITKLDLKFEHKARKDDVNNFEQFSPSQESAGTLRYLGLLAPFYIANKLSKLQLLDEIESSLHFDLQKLSLLMFLSNTTKSQLVVTTHNPLFLSWDIMRYDVIWFAEKQETGQTELFSLIDFNNLKRQNIMKKYLIGNYGAVPNIKIKIDDLK